MDDDVALPDSRAVRVVPREVCLQRIGPRIECRQIRVGYTGPTSGSGSTPSPPPPPVDGANGEVVGAGGCLTRSVK